MKLLKYFLFIAILIVTASFITELDKRNKVSDIVYEKNEKGEIIIDTLKSINHDGNEIKKMKNFNDNDPITVWVPFITGKDSKLGFTEPASIKWVVVISLSAGVAIGFLMALFQIISQKSHMIRQRSKLKKLQIELDSLRNQAIDDNIEIIDELDEIDTLDELDESDDEFTVK